MSEKIIGIIEKHIEAETKILMRAEEDFERYDNYEDMKQADTSDYTISTLRQLLYEVKEALK